MTEACVVVYMVSCRPIGKKLLQKAFFASYQASARVEKKIMFMYPTFDLSELDIFKVFRDEKLYEDIFYESALLSERGFQIQIK